MKIIISGGSIGGLSAGVALLQYGYDVEIFERAHELKDRGAGLVVQTDMMDYMIKTGISSEKLFGVKASQRQVMNTDGSINHSYYDETSYTSWGHIWQQLKDAFPLDKYHFDSALKSIDTTANSVKATFSNGEMREADLLIGAEGYSSFVRNFILPDHQPQYAGYIAYRGLISEQDLSKEAMKILDDRFSIMPYQNSHILSYFVPGIHGELEHGKRQYNWVWYVNQSEAHLQEILSDKDGRKRTFSVPPGFLSATSLEEMSQRAKAEFPPVLQEVVNKSPAPFVQVIEDLSVPKMYEGRIAILGDAAFTVRPHTASGTAKAHRDAVALAKAIYYNEENIPKALEHWNELRTEEAHRIIEYGLRLAKSSGLGFKTLSI